ncbi:MAG: Crp/Fnr family transcriptional regulator [Terriglobales bacterium]
MAPSGDLSTNRPSRQRRDASLYSFADLPLAILNDLDAMSCLLRFPGGVSLFVEGEPPRGIFHIRSGRVKMFICSGGGKTLILRMAKSGDVLGLPGTLSGAQYEVTAETVGPTQVAFVKRDTFLRFMDAHAEVSLAVAHQLTSIYRSACHEIRCLGLGHSVGEKLAKLLLEWPLSNSDTPIHIRFAFRHEEVAQMIGTTRESVSRVFGEFKKRQIAELDGSSLIIHDRTSLTAVASGKIAVWAASGKQPGKNNGHSRGHAESADPDSDGYFQPDGV